MSDVLEVLAWDVDSDGYCTVDAVVDDIVVVCPPSRFDPPEYGPALCRGSFYISDDTVIPVDERDRCAFVSSAVNYWTVLDTSDDGDYE